MLTVTLLFLFLGSFVAVTRAPINTEVRLTSQVYVCQGDVIDLMMTNEDPKSDITGSLIFKNGGGDETIVTKERDKDPEIAQRWRNRVDYENPLGIKINYATVNDSGPYEMHVVFEEGVAWHRWNVSVFTGCPKKSDYVSPGITYRLNQGPLEPLPDTKTIQFAAPKMLTLKVGIPLASLPVTCSIWGHGPTVSTAEGSGDETVYCQATFSFDQPENSTLHVELSHKIRSRVKTEVQVYATTAGRPNPDALGGETSSSPLLWLLFLLLVPAIIGLVAGIIVCKRKKFGIFKEPHVIASNTEEHNIEECQDETHTFIGGSGKEITLHQNDKNDDAELKKGLIQTTTF